MGFFGNYVKKFLNRLKDKFIIDIINDLEKQIEVHENLLKLLESIRTENTKIVKFIEKENEIINLLNKQKDYFTQMGLFLDLTNAAVSSFAIRERLEKDIINIIKELKKEKIL